MEQHEIMKALSLLKMALRVAGMPVQFVRKFSTFWNIRITEAGNTRITETGNVRVGE